MSAKKTLSLILALLCLGVVSRATAASLASEIQWIAGIPGVTLVTTTERSHRCEIIYTVAGSTDSALEAIRVRLTRDGWKVGDRSTVGSSGGAIRGLVARKGGRTLRVAGHEAAGIGGLVVNYSTGGPSQATQPPSHPVTSDGPVVAQGPAVQSGGDVNIDQGNQRQTYQMSGGTLTVNSSNNRIVVTGRCKVVMINGGHNQVTAQCKVGQIQCNGSWNKVQWSRSRNPNPPECTNWGMDNAITPID